MNKYVVAIYHYFSGYQNFTVNAENKTEALKNAKEEAKKQGSGNYDLNNAKVIKKLQRK